MKLPADLESMRAVTGITKPVAVNVTIVESGFMINNSFVTELTMAHVV